MGRLSDLPNVVKWRAALTGGVVIEPDTLTRREGPCIVFDSLLASRRRVWFSYEFKRSFPDVWTLVQHFVSLPSSKWSLLAGMDDFVNAKAMCQGPAVIAVITEEESADAAFQIPHVYSPDKFFKALQRIADVRRVCLLRSW